MDASFTVLDIYSRVPLGSRATGFARGGLLPSVGCGGGSDGGGAGSPAGAARRGTAGGRRRIGGCWVRGGEPGGGGAWPARAAGAGEERFDGAPFTTIVTKRDAYCVGPR